MAKIFNSYGETWRKPTPICLWLILDPDPAILNLQSLVPRCVYFSSYPQNYYFVFVQCYFFFSIFIYLRVWCWKVSHKVWVHKAILTGSFSSIFRQITWQNSKWKRNKVHSFLWIKAQKPLMAEGCGSQESHRGNDVRSAVARLLGGSWIKRDLQRKQTPTLCQLHNLVQGCFWSFGHSRHFAWLSRLDHIPISCHNFKSRMTVQVIK